MSPQNKLELSVDPKPTTQALKTALWRELELRIDLAVQGVSIEAEDFRALNLGKGFSSTPPAASSGAFNPGTFLPALASAFYLPYGIIARVAWNAESPYALVAESGKPVLYHYRRKKETRIGEVEFQKRSAFLDQKTSEGVPFRTISGFISPEGTIGGGLSQECSLKEKGEDCLFCDINVRQDAFTDRQFRKTAGQIAEVYAAAVEAGVANRINITGGFMPERRELDTYVDIAEAIKARVGQEKFIGSISMGAPLDYSVIDKYKEAGYHTVRMDIEVWDKNIRRAIVPGKENQCGGWENWVKALEYAVKVFGWGRVGSNIVAGLEPKKSTLEGVEYLASKGIGCPAGIFQPKLGTGLEGFRTPETSWHLDRAIKEAEILRRHGFTLEQLQHLKPFAQEVHYIYQIEEEQFENGKLKQWKFPALKERKRA
jgi:hypothetical protein